MTTEERTAVVRRFWKDVVERGEHGAAERLLAPGCVVRDPAHPDGEVHGPDSVVELADSLRGAISGLTVRIEESLGVEENRVVTRLSISGTHLRTGAEVRVTGISVSCVAGGKIAETWINWDALGMMRQLGNVSQSPEASTGEVRAFRFGWWWPPWS